MNENNINATESVAENTQPVATNNDNLKFCKYCGGKIHMDAVLCTHCGRQVEEIKGAQAAAVPNVVINNTNTNSNVNTNTVATQLGFKEKNKWVALLLCIFLGCVGGHKFYEGKVFLGIVYICTVGLFGIGVIVDFFALLFKSNPYYVR